MNLNIQPGESCIADGRVITIDGWDCLRTVSARDAMTGQLINVPIHQLQPLPTELQASDHLIVSQKIWDRCVALAKAFRPYIDRYQLPRDARQAIALCFAISERHVLRLRSKFLKNPRPSTLIPAKGGRPQGLRLLPVAVDNVMVHVFTKSYARRERTSKSEIVLRVRSLCRRLHLKPPCEKTILARIAVMQGPDLDRRRLGVHASKQRWEARPGRLNIDCPLAMVQIDHTLMDVILLSEDRSRVIGRPWITLAIDVATRVVLGFYLSMHAPSSVSVSLCIEHAVLPKGENESDAGLWPMYGKPALILVDNGKDLKSIALQRGCDEHGIELRWRPVKRPHYGAHIERLNGTLMAMVHGLPGTTFSNIQERGDYPSEARAIMTLRDLRGWLVQKICRLYHVRPHRGLGVPPLIAWERAWRDSSGVLIAPPIVPNPLSFRIDFLPLAIRRVQRTGVEFLRSRYWHDGLLPLAGPETQAVLRYDPDDLSRIWLRTTDHRVLEVPVVAGRALTEQREVQPDEAEALRLENEMDLGFELCDRVEEEAARATRRHQRLVNRVSHGPSRGKRGGKKHRVETRPETTPELPVPPPNRSMVSVEVLDS